MGMGETYADYCSQVSERMSPPGRFNCGATGTWQAGICKPMTFAALAAFKNVQTQLNRIAKAKGWPAIGVDGALGPSAVALFNRAVPTMNSVMGYHHTADWTCDAIALQATNMGAALKATADRLPAATVAGGGSSSGSGSPGGAYVPPGPPPPTGMDSLMNNPWALGGMALGGFLIVNDKGAKKARRKGKSKRRRAGRRRR
jgi:hypothetical protein